MRHPLTNTTHAQLLELVDGMTKEEREVETAAMKIYYTHWKQQISGGFPPVWQDTTESIREFTRAQARNVLDPTALASVIPSSVGVAR